MSTDWAKMPFDSWVRFANTALRKGGRPNVGRVSLAWLQQQHAAGVDPNTLPKVANLPGPDPGWTLDCKMPGHWSTTVRAYEASQRPGPKAFALGLAVVVGGLLLANVASGGKILPKAPQSLTAGFTRATSSIEPGTVLYIQGNSEFDRDPPQEYGTVVAVKGDRFWVRHVDGSTSEKLKSILSQGSLWVRR
jgi:hypothetical protein